MAKFINYAHRGASEYVPENTLLAFNIGIFMGANGIETDVRMTKDGVAVLFHDDSLERMTGQSGSVEDYTYEELSRFLVSKNGFNDKIAALDDFLSQFAFRDITFALELKGEGCERTVAESIRKYGIEKKTVVTSFSLEYLKKLRAYAPDIRTGHLAYEITDGLLGELKALGISELCPKAELINVENVYKWHCEGFNVRAWGVKTVEQMKNVYDCGADGMTVNFPDKLTEYINESQQ